MNFGECCVCDYLICQLSYWHKRFSPVYPRVMVLLVVVHPYMNIKGILDNLFDRINDG